MQVLVTGGTGHVGSHIVAALLDAGHAVRVLARIPERVNSALEPLGWSADDVEVVQGDVLGGPEALAAAMNGVDAVLHAANVYSLNQADAQQMRDVNVGGTLAVLRTAVERELSPIVHVSSVVALLPCEGTMTSATPTGDPEGPYLESKAEAERVALALADEGAEVVVTNPGMVLGPHDPHLGDSTEVLRSLLSDPVSVNVPGSFPVVDVRDLGAAHARILTLDRPERRYLLAGRALTFAEFRDVAREITGRWLPLVSAPQPLLRAAGKFADAAQRRGVDPGFSSMNLYTLRHGVPVDDHREQEALGVPWRPVEDTLKDTIEWLHEAGHLSQRHAGLAASASTGA
jgi:dihydroflavonol-4-reductase